jgi:hypothetical protein
MWHKIKGVKPNSLWICTVNNGVDHSFLLLWAIPSSYSLSAQPHQGFKPEWIQTDYLTLRLCPKRHPIDYIVLILTPPGIEVLDGRELGPSDVLGHKHYPL